MEEKEISFKNTNENKPENSSGVFLFTLAMIFVLGLLVSNISASNVFYTSGIISLSAAEFIFPITYIVNDLLNEFFDMKKVVKITLVGILITFISMVCLYLTTLLPTGYVEYQTVFGFFTSGVVGITIASFIAYIAGSLVNSLIMGKLKQKDKDKKFFKRAIASSVVAELVDSFVFITGCCMFASHFYFWDKLLSLALTIFVIKILVEILVFPLTNLIRNQVKKHGWV